jgi:hypothetical protein
VCASLTALVLLPSCATGDHGGAPTSESSAAATTTVGLTPVPAPHVKNWFDLKVGDCLTEMPDIEVGTVSTTVVGCATPHTAEVYLLAPLKVDTAIDQVAGEKCAEGFVDYTGQPVDGSALRMTYLIDSNQDRTTNNPTPSTAICFLQSADGVPLTDSARS